MQSEIWFWVYFEHTEFDGDVNFFCFTLEVPILGKFRPKKFV